VQDGFSRARSSTTPRLLKQALNRLSVSRELTLLGL
jgi:hypothetical protein